MSELAQAIEEMRNMRESYDQIGAAAESYNTGKTELAANITAKGVEASATETLPELAEKVAAISQETYEINGGEMYAKQLFGVANNDIVPGYWNLYDILAQLLSDGRLVNYGGILLAEYYKDYDSLALAGAGSGGAYVVSDKDEQGNFIMYTEDTTHTWDTNDDGKGNRWVAYCFADAGHDFQITDTNTSPRSIFIGRKVGTITCLANSRVSDVIVPDGNELVLYKGGSYTSNWSPKQVIRNIKEVTAKQFYPNDNIDSIYLEADILSSAILDFPIGSLSRLASLIIKANTITNAGIWSQYEGRLNSFPYLATLIIDGVQECETGFSICNYPSNDKYGYINAPILRTIYFTNCEELKLAFNIYVHSNCPELHSLFFGYKTNDRTKSFVVTYAINKASQFTDVELLNGWCKPLNVSELTSLTAENIVNHILNRLGDNSGQSSLTITLGATNLAKLTAEEKAIATNKGFTLA